MEVGHAMQITTIVQIMIRVVKHVELEDNGGGGFDKMITKVHMHTFSPLSPLQITGIRKI